jgi:radical SAM protein with 4Fe4S-binding SPASM domain
LWATREYVASLGVDFRFDSLLMPRLDGSRLPLAVRLSPEQVVALDLEDLERRKELERLRDEFWGLPTNDRLYGCGAGERMFHIDPYGRLTLCITNRAHTFDLRHGSFRVGWRDFFPEVRSQEAKREVKCRTCPAVSLCGQCPAWSYLEHRDLETPVEFLCNVGHLRVEALKERASQEDKLR